MTEEVSKIMQNEIIVNSEAQPLLSTASPKAKKIKRHITPMTVILLAVLLLYSVSLFIPILWGFTTSLKDRLEFRTNVFGIPDGWPWEWEWNNYSYAFINFIVKVEAGAGFRVVYMEEMFLYTILYALGCAFFQSFICCLVAYMVVKFNYFFSKILYTAVIVAMILPIVGALPSEIQMARSLLLFDHIWGMWIMKSHFLGMYFLVFHAMFRGIPKEFADAARVDGAGNFQVLFRIMFPLVRNTLFTVVLLNFIGYWNDYQVPLIYLPSYPTIAYGLYLFNFSTTNSLSHVTMKITGCMIMMLPILIIFIIFRNRLIGNISMGGLKE